MQAVILAAGCGSRMGDATAEIPKAFLEVNDRTLYDRQREALDGRVDGITIVLGYRCENVIGDLTATEVIVLEGWEKYENAESLRRALECIDDDVLVLNGDVVVTPSVIDRLLQRHEALNGRYNVVACLPGRQTEHTAIRCDEEGTVIDYGMVPGLRHAGVGIVSRRYRTEAIEFLARNRTEWYPHVYAELPTKRHLIPPVHHLEINRPDDLASARKRLSHRDNRRSTASTDPISKR
ncbi:NTP transferase domain-containing protein [Haladaptatus salinisoli]|uniref:NTP transferase domain-containing protein n=1 Tax=Haladaptatus salinisoli TaxID=2884876 RepID=UPI001D0B44C1|nr:NTP transferase domain-containing protein [Haladaptatus salinisoli]